jgi:predicted ATPase
MITEWILERFKSIAERQTLTMRPLTVLAGANSSGKSTVLQSMLLLAQTLASKVERRQLSPNGELVRLGTLEDLLSRVPDSKELTIGFTISVDPRVLRSQRVVQRALAPYGNWFRPQTKPGPINVELKFTRSTEGSDPARAQRAELLSAKFTSGSSATPADSPQAQMPAGTFRVARRSQADADLILTSASTENVSEESLSQALHYSLTSDAPLTSQQFTWRLMFGRPEDPLDVVGVGLDHFLSNVLVIRYPAVAEQLQAYLSELLTAQQRGQGQSAVIGAWRAQGDEVQRALAAVLDGLSNEERLRLLVPGRETLAVPRLLPLLTARLANSDALRRMVFTLTPPSTLMTYVHTCITAEFSLLRYLGPLRDEPRPLYAIGSAADPRDVGIKGEFTAAVLDVFADTFVDFVSPADPNGPVEARTLRAAVHAWLQHFGIAESCETEEAGKLGHRLYVIPQGVPGKLDLTNVGVGVSQVLPILVMALISEPGSVLLFEQPELHLHPRVQSSLADFFISVIRAGRQCIVETHSEYLVNRLRRRVAESTWESELGDNILLYFVEREGLQSRFRAIDVNPYGAIPDWPAGFFDQGPAESEAIMAASTKKRLTKPGVRGPNA